MTMMTNHVQIGRPGWAIMMYS